MNQIRSSARIAPILRVFLFAILVFSALAPREALAVFSGYNEVSDIVPGQAVPPQSPWTSIIGFDIIDTACSLEDGPIFFHGVTVTFEPVPGTLNQAEEFRPAYLSKVGIALESNAVAGYQYYPNADLILYERLVPTIHESQSVTFRFPEEGKDLGQGLDGPPCESGVRHYYIIFQTSIIFNNVQFRAYINFCPRPGGVELTSPTPDPTLLPYFRLVCHRFTSNAVTCVDNVEDWIPTHYWNWAAPTGPSVGLGQYGTLLAGGAVGGPGLDFFKNRELEFFPGRYPRDWQEHPQAEASMSWLERPQLISSNSDPYPILGLELGGGVSYHRASITSLTFRLISNGQKKELISDGIDNDLDGAMDDFLIGDHQLPNRNEDWDFWVDSDPKKDAKGMDGEFVLGVDPVVIDVNYNGVIDTEDTILYGGVGDATFNSQLVGFNDDADVWSDDFMRNSILPIYIPGVDEVLREAPTGSNIYPNTTGIYDGTSLDETQVGDSTVFYGSQANRDAHGALAPDCAEDDRKPSGTDLWRSADFWTGRYNITRPNDTLPDGDFAARGSFFGNVAAGIQDATEGLLLSPTDPVAVFLDDGTTKGVLDTGDHLISYPSSRELAANNDFMSRLDYTPAELADETATYRVPNPQVYNIPNLFLLKKGINVRGLNDDYLFNHPRTDEDIYHLFEGHPALKVYADRILNDPDAGEQTQALLGVKDATEFYRIPIGDSYIENTDPSNGRYDPGTDEIWIDMQMNGVIVPPDWNAFPVVRDASPIADPTLPQDVWLHPSTDGYSEDEEGSPANQLRDVWTNNADILQGEYEENYNDGDDDGDGYTDEDVADYRLFILINEDDYDFWLDTDGDGQFMPDVDNYYLDGNADGVYQKSEFITGATDPFEEGIQYLAQGALTLDNDTDGNSNEDPRRRIGNDINVKPKSTRGELIDEDAFDGIDNDLDGLVDEDSWYVPLNPLVDEERLDYFVDEPGRSLGVFDNGYDEYYIDLDADGMYDSNVRGPLYRNEDECIHPGVDNVKSLRDHKTYGNSESSRYRFGIDNDFDGLVNEDVRDSNIQLPDFKANYSDGTLDGFSVWYDADRNGTFNASGDQVVSSGYLYTRLYPPGVPAAARPPDLSWNEDLLIKIFFPADRYIPVTDDGNFDFFLCVRTDSGAGGSSLSGDSAKIEEDRNYGVDWGDDFSVQCVRLGTTIDQGVPLAQEQSKRQVAMFFGADPIGFSNGYTGVYTSTPQGNLLDDDRDGRMDEEIANGVDEDGDGEDNDNNPMTPARADGLDNDGDGLIDEGIDEDLGWQGLDGTVKNSWDDDGDGRIDEENLNGFDDDWDGEDEDNNPLTRAMADGIDNDGDGLIDEGIDEDLGTFGTGYSETYTTFRGVPYTDATNRPIPVLALNVCSGPGFPSSEVIDSVRVNFVNEDLEGNGKFEISDLKPLGSNPGNLNDPKDGVGVALYKDNKASGDIGDFDLGDEFVPITENMLEWDKEGMADPLVKQGGHYVTLKPTYGAAIPPDDYHAANGDYGNSGYDYFICIQTSETIDYHDAFRCFIRDGDVKFTNGQNSINTGFECDPIASNVPTILTSLISPASGETSIPLTANSAPKAIIGMDMHDSNKTFDGKPSKIQTMLVHFFNEGGDTGFTSTDIAPLLPADRQWVVIDPATGRTRPYQLGSGLEDNGERFRIGSANGIALYRDDPNSDTKGVFDDPFDLSVAHPDTPILLSGRETWDFMIGWSYEVTLMIDYPEFDGRGTDSSPVDPFDPDPYETLPEEADLGRVHDDFFVVIKTSETISYGDDFHIEVNPHHDGGWVIEPIFFYPMLYNSQSHPFPQTPPWSRFEGLWPLSEMNASFERLTTSIFKCPTITVTNFRSAITGGTRQDATSDALQIFGIDCYDATPAFEKLNAVRIEARNIEGFDPKIDLKPVLSSGEGGVQLYIDTDKNGSFDIRYDTPVTVNDTEWKAVYYANNPGLDGILGNSDDPGQIGVYNPGIDELFTDDKGYIPGYYDPSDTVIDDGLDNKMQTLPASPTVLDSTLYLLPESEERWSLTFIPRIPVDVPDAFDNGRSDFLLVARTSENIDFHDRYQFTLSRDAIRFSSGQSRGNADVTTYTIDTNVPTYLLDKTLTSPNIYDGTMRQADTAYPVLAMNMVNDTSYESFVRSIKMVFKSIGQGFNPADDLQSVLPILLDGGKRFASGVGVFRDTNGNGEFDPTMDTFVRLTTAPQWISLGSNPDPKYEITLLLDPLGQNDLLRVPMDKDRLETGEIKPDFFIVLMPTFGSLKGDAFTVQIPPHGIIFRNNGIDSGETITTLPVTIDVNAPPFITLSQPLSRRDFEPEPVVLSGQLQYTITWLDGDNDDNASVNLYYGLVANATGNPLPENLVLLTTVPIQENDPANRFSWTVSDIASGDYRVVATIDDGKNPQVRDISGIVRIQNVTPTIQITHPAPSAKDQTSQDTYTITWKDSDLDNDAGINLYATARVFEPTYQITAADLSEASGTIPLASGISEDASGTLGAFNLPLAQLFMDGKITYDQPLTIIATIDDRIAPKAAGFVDAVTFSLGTVTYVEQLMIQIVDPLVDVEVLDSYKITWKAASSGGQDATVTLRFSEIAFGYKNDQQIADGIAASRFATDSLILNASYKILGGSYTWNILYFDQDTYTSKIKSGTKYYIYGDITNASREKVGNVSAGRLSIKSHLFELLTPTEARELATDPYTITWRYFTDKPPATLSLYLDTDSIPGGGTLIANNLPANNGYPSKGIYGKFDWHPKDLPGGEYRIYAIFDDGYDGTQMVYAPGSVTVNQMSKASVFMLDGCGQFHFEGGAMTPGWPKNYGWDVARSVKADPSGQGFYLLDAFGGLLTFGTAVNMGSLYYYEDGVKDIELAPDKGYYILNGYGLVDTTGNAVYCGDPPFTGEDRYVDLEPTLTGKGYYVADVSGAIHTFGDAQPFIGPLLTNTTARDIELTPDGKGMYLLDSIGQVKALGTAANYGSIPFVGADVQDLLLTADGKGYLIMDASGELYPFGVAPQVQVVTSPLVYPKARDLEFLWQKIDSDRRTVTGLSNPNAQITVSSDWLVWSATGTKDWDLYLYDVAKDATRVLVTDAQDQLNPSLDANKVNGNTSLVYTSVQNGKKEIYSLIISPTGEASTPVLVSGQELRQEQPDISSNMIAWSAYKQTTNTWDILMKALGGTSAPLNLTNTGQTDEREPSIELRTVNGSETIYVAWERRSGADTDVYLYRGARNGQGTVAMIGGGPGNQVKPKIRYPWLVYTDANRVMLYSLLENKPPFPATASTAYQSNPVLSKTFAAWIDRRNDDLWDVYAFDLISGERRVTLGYQIVYALSASRENLAWIESSGDRTSIIFQRWKPVPNDLLLGR